MQRGIRLHLAATGPGSKTQSIQTYLATSFARQVFTNQLGEDNVNKKLCQPFCDRYLDVSHFVFTRCRSWEFPTAFASVVHHASAGWISKYPVGFADQHRLYRL